MFRLRCNQNRRKLFSTKSSNQPTRCLMSLSASAHYSAKVLNARNYWQTFRDFLLTTTGNSPTYNARHFVLWRFEYKDASVRPKKPSFPSGYPQGTSAGSRSHGGHASTYPCGLGSAKDSLINGFSNVAEASLYSNFKQPADTQTTSGLGLMRSGTPKFSISAKHELSSY